MIIQTAKTLRPRAAFDHYPTPSGLVRAAYAQLLPATFAPQAILDPGAGTGVWGAVARTRWQTATIVGVEIQPSAPCPAYSTWYAGWDFTRWALWNAYAPEGRTFDLVVGNPPYKWAEAFVRLALALTRPGGYVIQLLRLNFLESQTRARGLWRELTPQAVWTCARRPSFTGNGKTDATAYAVYLWQKENHPPTYAGGWLDWDYGSPIAEDAPFQPFRLLVG